MLKMTEFLKRILQNNKETYTNENPKKQQEDNDLKMYKDIENSLDINLKEEKKDTIEEELFKMIREDKQQENVKLEHTNIIEDVIYEFPPIELLIEEPEINEILSSKEFKDNKSKSIVGLKENTAVKIIDIQETSHILIAGTTGIGKTTLLDNVILYKATPSEVKFVMFDTNNNSLRIYNGIPHLLIPVITNAKRAIGALAWIVQEIENRYQLFLTQDTDNIIEYNNIAEKIQMEKLPKILVMIDELIEIMNNDKELAEEFLIKISKFGKKA